MRMNNGFVLPQAEARGASLASRIAILLIKSVVVVLPAWLGFLLWGVARLTGLY